MGQPTTGYEYFTLDVFTSELFRGNPLAVVNDADDLSEQQMQAVASEFNLSETVFVCRPDNAENTAKLRIFTPTRELPFAGHPTIGTAILLAEFGEDFSREWQKTIKFEEGIGVVPVAVSKTPETQTYAELAAAKLPEKVNEVPDADAVAASLGIGPQDIGFGLHRISRYDAGNMPLFVPVASRQLLAIVTPHMENWDRLGGAGEFGVYVYCRGGNGSEEFHGRFFAPEHGILEDPATGSAVVAFAGALNEALVLENGSHAWIVHQGEDMGRASRIDLKADVKDEAVTSVRVGGNAVRVTRGVISV